MPLAHEGPVPMEELRAWWDSRIPEGLRDMDLGWAERLDLALFHFEDCGLWRIEDDALVQTDLGRDFALTYVQLLEDGHLQDGW
jgi:hypothetical protein